MQKFCKGGWGGANLGVLGGSSYKQPSSVRGRTGRQCLKISLVILRGDEIDTRGGECPFPLNTPQFRI